VRGHVSLSFESPGRCRGAGCSGGLRDRLHPLSTPRRRSQAPGATKSTGAVGWRPRPDVVAVPWAPSAARHLGGAGHPRLALPLPHTVLFHRGGKSHAVSALHELTIARVAERVAGAIHERVSAIVAEPIQPRVTPRAIPPRHKFHRSGKVASLPQRADVLRLSGALRIELSERDAPMAVGFTPFALAL